MKYEIGDIVKVKDGLQVGEKYGNCEVLEGMLEYRGKMYVIIDIDFDGDYSLKSIANPKDTNYYSWHKDMLEPVVIQDDLKQSTHVDKIKEENNMKYKIGDVVEIRDDLKKGEKYGDCDVNERMLKFRGTTDTIENIDEDGDFYLAGKDNPYAWHKDMLELVTIKEDLKESANVDKDSVKYKIGDIVKVRDDLQEGEKYGDCFVVEGMLKFKGTTGIIYYIDTVGDFYLSDKDNNYVWHKDMVVPVTIKNDLKKSTHVDEIKEGNDMGYKVGDVVRIKNDLQVGEKYGKCRVIESMLKFKGTLDTIESIDKDGDFELANEDNPYSWHKDMVVPIKQIIPINDLESGKMDRLAIYQYILNNLEETYKAKNNDYGNSFADTYEKFGCVSFLVRITDEYNKLLTLCDPNIPEQRVKKIDDTVLDLANYCLLWLVEREHKNQ